jgi:membrane-bound metal-dependent hydrolase YbcI (DUF457 family)
VFIFGHIGITLGAAVIIAGALHRSKKSTFQSDSPAHPAAAPDVTTKLTPGSSTLVSWIESLSSFMDVRLLVVGSMLPDIIDKPLGFFGFGDGRSITHTLLVTIILLAVAAFLYLRYHRTWLLAIAAGTVCHVLLDGMWNSLYVFYWPAYGWTFPDKIFSSFWSIWVESLLHNPAAFIPESLGVIVVIGLFWWLMGSRKFFSLIVRGRINS